MATHHCYWKGLATETAACILEFIYPFRDLNAIRALLRSPIRNPTEATRRTAQKMLDFIRHIGPLGMIGRLEGEQRLSILDQYIIVLQGVADAALDMLGYWNAGELRSYWALAWETAGELQDHEEEVELKDYAERIEKYALEWIADIKAAQQEMLFRPTIPDALAWRLVSKSAASSLPMVQNPNDDLSSITSSSSSRSTISSSFSPISTISNVSSH